MPKEERDASLQEAKLLSALHHPNMIAVHAVAQYVSKILKGQ